MATDGSEEKPAPTSKSTGNASKGARGGSRELWVDSDHHLPLSMHSTRDHLLVAAL